jgi:hypothetical protein
MRCVGIIKQRNNRKTTAKVSKFGIEKLKGHKVRDDGNPRFIKDLRESEHLVPLFPSRAFILFSECSNVLHPFFYQHRKYSPEKWVEIPLTSRNEYL